MYIDIQASYPASNIPRWGLPVEIDVPGKVPGVEQYRESAVDVPDPVSLSEPGGVMQDHLVIANRDAASAALLSRHRSSLV